MSISLLEVFWIDLSFNCQLQGYKFMLLTKSDWWVSQKIPCFFDVFSRQAYFVFTCVS